MAGATLPAAGQLAPASAGSAAVSGSGGTVEAPAAKLSFAKDVFPMVIRSKCGFCHNDGPSFGGLALFPTADTAFANLVGVPSGKEEGYLCAVSELNRVQPGEPDKSLLYLKLTNPPCGKQMPPGMFGTTTPEQVEMVRKWILEGALP